MNSIPRKWIFHPPFKLRWAYFDIFILTIHPPFKLKWKTKVKYFDIFWSFPEYFWMPHCLTYQPNWTLPGTLPGHSLMVMVPLRSLSICRKASRTCYLQGSRSSWRGNCGEKCVAVMLYIYTLHIQYMHNISHTHIYIYYFIIYIYMRVCVCEVGTRHPKPKVHDSTQLYFLKNNACSWRGFPALRSSSSWDPSTSLSPMCYSSQIFGGWVKTLYPWWTSK